jgi:hypothetical protein
VLTSEEAQEFKLKEQQEKICRDENKKARQQARAVKQQEKLARNRRTTRMTSASSITENEKSNTVNDENLSGTGPKNVKKNSSEAKKNRKDEKRTDSLTRTKTRD